MSYSNGTGAGSGASSAASSSRSKRELIDRVRYPNPIPVPPYPPKLVKIATEPSRYANPHFADRLASQQPIPMVVDVHAGMHIDLANFQNLWEGDLSEVTAPASATLDAKDLDDADAFLLQDFATNLPPASNSAAGAIGLITSLKATDDPASQATLQAALQQRHTQSLGPGAKAALAADDVTWLRRTEYLSAQQKAAQQQVQKPKVAERIDVSREAQLAKIEKSFTDAQMPLRSLVHPHKKGLKAVQVFDFLPDPETWATDYQVVRFIDHPGRIVNGVPQSDPRLDVALLRPVSAADGEQRVSYYLPAGEDVPEDPEEPMTLIDNRDIEETNARRLRKRRRTGKFPLPPAADEEDDENRAQPKLLKKDHATPYKLSRDYVPKDTAESAHDVLLLTLDDGIPDADPDADIDPIKGKSAPTQDGDEDDDLFGDDDEDAQDAASARLDSTLPPQSEFERQKRSRRSAATKGKERSEQPDGDGITSESRPKARAYYHKVGMRFTLRVWRSRFANNEKLRNRDRRYPGKWDAVVLSNRQLEEREKLRRLHARSQVDDVGELDPYDPEDEFEEALAEDDVDVEAAANDAVADVFDEDKDAGDDADGEVDDVDRTGANDADDQADEQAEDDGSDDDDDDDDEDEDDDEDGTVDGDEELAALRAEAGEAGEDLEQDGQGGSRRSRSRRSGAAATESDAVAAAMDEDDE